MSREEQAAVVSGAADVLARKLAEFTVVMENNNSCAWMRHGPCGGYVVDIDGGDDMAVLTDYALGHACESAS